MKMKRLFAQILALALCAALLCPLTAFAEGETASGIPADPESYAVIDPQALQKLVEDYVSGHNLNKDKISIGYCYLDTGDTWYYNGDTWYYSCSMYKVPLMMLLAQWEADGKVERDSVLKGLPLGDAERYILVYNSNDYAHTMMGLFGSDKECRTQYQTFSDLPEEYYDPDFYDYSYFTARFTTDVMKTLYLENERFPNIVECMKEAENGKYIHGALQGEYEVAQRSGFFVDRRGVQYNNVTGIVYTEHPFVLTVMTQDMGTDETILRDMAVIFKDYTLSLDESYAAWLEQKDNPAPAATETPAGPAGNAPAGESAASAEPAESTAPAGETPAEGQIQPATAEAEEAQVELSEEEQAKKDAMETETSRRLIVLLLGSVLLVVLILGAILQAILRKKNAREREEYEY